MYEATFDLEAITPIFMRGADQRKAEIRASSIKGLMRWWFRALAGNYFGNDVAGLKRSEEYVFGSTKRRSRVVVEVDVIHKKLLNINKEFKNWTEAIVWTDCIDYFWAFAIDKRTVGKGSNKKITARLRTPAYDSGTKFVIKLSGYDVDAFRIAEYSLWALIYFGGIGFRSRKFGGSLSVIDYNGDCSTQFIPKQKFNKYISSNLLTILKNTKKALENIRIKTNAKWKFKEVDEYPKYPAFIKGFSSVFIGNKYSTWKEVIDAVGKWYIGKKQGKEFVGGLRFSGNIANRKFSHNFERLYRKERFEVENEKRPYLGLPVNYFNYKTIVFGNKPNIQRRASGLIFTINKVSNTYYPTITVLSYQFLPHYTGSLLYSKKDRNRHIFIENGEITLMTNGRKDNNFSLIELYNYIIDNLRREKEFTQVVFP